jgi:hypothetical protein
VTEKVTVSVVFPLLVIPVSVARLLFPLVGKPLTFAELACAVHENEAPEIPLDQFTGTVATPEQILWDKTVFVTDGDG